MEVKIDRGGKSFCLHGSYTGVSTAIEHKSERVDVWLTTSKSGQRRPSRNVHGWRKTDVSRSSVNVCGRRTSVGQGKPGKARWRERGLSYSLDNKLMMLVSLWLLMQLEREYLSNETRYRETDKLLRCEWCNTAKSRAAVEWQLSRRMYV